MRDNYMPLAVGVQTASTTGTPLDLLKGTNVEKDNRPGVDLLGAAGAHTDLAAVITISGVGGTNNPAAVMTLNQSDDNVNYTALTGSVTATQNGDLRIPFNPTKRFIRLDTVITGTNPTFTLDAYVGTRPT